MKRLRWLTVLMAITLVIVVGFQVYWLKDNYDRERRTLQIKANVAFQETIQQLQMTKLKLPGLFKRTQHPKEDEDIFIDQRDDTNMMMRPRRGMITMVNALNTKLNDSVKNRSSVNSKVIISFGKGQQVTFKDSSSIKFKRSDSSDRIFQILYKVDSLQDSLKLTEITKEYSATLKREKLNVPFIISRSESIKPPEQDNMSDVTVGFAHPVTYHLTVLNATPFLFKKLSLPILFSFFLAAVTIFSFVLVYRNLLRQHRLAEIKNEFISNITHELKTPIATVGVAIEALKNFNAIHDPQKTKEYLAISGNELQRLSLLVDKVLKLSMFENKQIELNKEHFDLKEVIREVLDSMRLQFEKNNAAVNFSAEGNNFMINADKLHITSVIYNLLDNALKYSKEDPVINVRLSLQKNIFELKISDNGIGIGKEYLTKIFDKFFRVPNGNKHSVKGYGLGLSYVSEIIKRHMGSILVESDLHKGSTFTIKLPEG